MMRRVPPIAAILLAGLAVRLVRADLPILEVAATRQAQTAAIARTFHREGIDLLHPRVDDLPEPRTLVLECPLYNAAVALLYDAAGGVYEGLGRALSALCACGAAWFLYALARDLHGEAVGLGSAATLLLLPVSILYTRTLQPEGVMLLCGTGALWALARFLRDGRIRDGVAFGTLLAATGLVKVHMLLVLGPALFLAAHAPDRRRRAAATVAAGVALAIAAAWVLHAGRENRAFETRYGYNYGVGKWFDAGLLVSPAFWVEFLDRQGGVVLTPLGAALLLCGFLDPTSDRRQRLFPVWLACGYATLLAFNRNSMTHDYYHLLVAPPAAVLVARGGALLARAGAFRTRGRVALACAIAAAVVGRHAAGGYRLPPAAATLPEAGRAVQRLAREGERIVAAGGSGPAFLYYCDRKGRGLHIPAPGEVAALEARLRERGAVDPVVDPARIVEEERAGGATLLAVTALRDFERNEPFRRYCEETLELLEAREGAYRIYRIPPAERSR